jgi:DNA-binding LytR/AlgR family response regulator
LGYTTPRREQDILCLRKDGVLYPFRIDRIIYIESQNHNITIHEKDGKSEKMPYMTCRQILEEANNSALIQCSRGAIINRNYVKTIDKANRIIDLKGCGTQIVMGGVYVKNIIKAFYNEYENI